MDTASADAHCRRHLEARRACLAAESAALRERALALWHRAHARIVAGGDPTPLERLACDAEAECRRVTRALLAIGRELDGAGG